MTGKSAFLIEVKGSLSLDCLGTEVSILNFCKKVDREGRALTRGIALPQKEDILCEYANSIQLRVSCKVNIIRDDCFSPKKACMKLKGLYAEELSLFHSSNPRGANLNCHFVKNEVLDQSLY